MILSPRNLKWVKDSICSASSFTQEIAKSYFIIIYIYRYIQFNLYNVWYIDLLHTGLVNNDVLLHSHIGDLGQYYYLMKRNSQ